MPVVDLKEATAAYQSATQYFLNLARGLTADALDAHAEGQWSPRQIIHHVADGEAHFFIRLRLILAEGDSAVIHSWNEDPWALSEDLAYATAPVEHPIALIAATRASAVETLQRLSESDLERFSQHEDLGKFTVATWLEKTTNHIKDHAEQLIRATKGQA